MDCLPLPVLCIQCGTDQNPCHCKIVGPTLGMYVMGVVPPVPSLEEEEEITVIVDRIVD